MTRPLLLLRIVIVFLISAPAGAGAATPTFFTDGSTFDTVLLSSVTDDYTDAGYAFINSDAAMSAVLGETDYTSTGFANHNIVLSGTYCAGCNGSFQLSFTSTSVGTSGGVGAVGATIGGNQSSLPYYAFITYGDSTTEDVALPAGGSFFGVTAPELVTSIHFGLSGGATTTDGSFHLSALTVGCASPDGDGDGVSVCNGDCDDTDASVYPGATEVCDGIDNDCNGSADFDLAGEVDADGDGDLSCSDCDDNDISNFYGNIERCDGADNDCNGLADFMTPLGDDDDSAGDDDDSSGDDDDSAAPESDSEELDIDGDGYLACADDCDDESEDFAPGAPELCDGFDNDCDGALPDDEADADMDGQMACEGDCDDADDTTYLGAPEICDGIDNDCDTLVDDEELDSDGDGLSPCEGDCDDTNDAVNPSGTEDTEELCNDTLDNDCDGDTDIDDSDCDGLVGDDDDSAGDDDRGGCNCTVSPAEGGSGFGLLLLGLLGLIRGRRGRVAPKLLSD